MKTLQQLLTQVKGAGYVVLGDNFDTRKGDDPDAFTHRPPFTLRARRHGNPIAHPLNAKSYAGAVGEAWDFLCAAGNSPVGLEALKAEVKGLVEKHGFTWETGDHVLYLHNGTDGRRWRLENPDAIPWQAIKTWIIRQCEPRVLRARAMDALEGHPLTSLQWAARAVVLAFGTGVWHPANLVANTMDEAIEHLWNVLLADVGSQQGPAYDRKQALDLATDIVFSLLNNPWRKTHHNATLQMWLTQYMPELAERMKAVAAGDGEARELFGPKVENGCNHIVGLTEAGRLVRAKTLETARTLFAHCPLCGAANPA